MRSKKEMQVLEALEAAALEQGFDLVDIESSGSGHTTLLRVYVDRPGGLNLDDVAAANTWIAKVVEELDPYKGSYTLEVSSPGIDRPLRTMAHFEAAIGEEITVTLENSAATVDTSNNNSKQRRKYTGMLIAVDHAQQRITLEASEETYELKYSDINKAKVKGRVDFESRKDS